MSSSIKHCANCGATIRFDARFCDSCGQPQLAYASTATGLLTTTHELKLRYRIIEKLGQGGFGAIYKVEDLLFTNAIRAVKEMGMRGLDAQETQEAISAFKHEAMLLANLSHPNLPHIYDNFEELGRWYLVMDYIDGQTLAKHLEEAPAGKLPLPEVLQIGLQLCTVLDYLHNHQPPIIFRALKPDNVMLTKSGQLYLIDFGIARFFKPGQAKDTVNLGTPGYASPEQYGRMQTTVRSDIYSLGATLYHLVSGINPGLNPFLFQSLDLDPKRPGNAELETLIMQMLEMYEDKRPTSAKVVKQELQRIEDMQEVAVNQPARLAPAGTAR
ncbi:MAG TPA: serine/threonine-protein kinase, partial [Ktedonobacteraceae bacterium]|nr:serine/threonine-protein kinase [Ktedonobacteraceae bacterium]